MAKVRVAISGEFLTAFSRLPRSQQKKVREFTEKFRQDPTRRGINYEKVQGAKDPKIRSVRIDKCYRAIVVKPPAGDIYLCAWVDEHDAAYAWARNKRFEVNPRLGHIQVFEVVEPPPMPTPAPVPAARVAPPTPSLLSDVSVEELELFGVPEALLPSIRSLRSESDLNTLNPFLPADVSDALYLLAAGYSAEEVIEELDRAAKVPPKPVDTEDFDKALQQTDSQRQFKVVETDRELGEMLGAPLEQWRIFLHPTQRKLVQWNVNGPIRVLGGAGTGKTVVLMHRAAYLARTCEPQQRILVTTYTRNLALDLKNHLQNLCSEEQFERLEVANLHSWARRFMSAQGVRFQVVDDDTQKQFWSHLSPDDLNLPHSFYKEEWDKVVQANDITDRSLYLKARRVGRGTRLSRKQRARVWEVFAAYRARLEAAGLVEWADLIRETRLYLEQNPGLLPYRCVLSDEVQDFRPADLRLLRAMVPEALNDLFLVGDAHQRIYGYKTSLGACGIAVRGRSRRLKINYRTTEQIGIWAVRVLEGADIDDLDDGTDTLKGYRSLRLGVPPEIRHFRKEAEEAEFLVRQIQAWLKDQVPAESICVTAPTGPLLEKRYRPLLENHGIDTVVLDRQTPLAELSEGVRLSTMHRMKGLEFPRVLIAGINSSTMPRKAADLPDDASREDQETGERCLLYVAATRARDQLVITGFGEPSPFVRVPALV